MAMAEMFNGTQGNIYAIEASGRDLTDEQLNILKSKFGDEVVSKYIINLTLDKDNPKTFKEATHDCGNKREGKNARHGGRQHDFDDRAQLASA